MSEEEKMKASKLPDFHKWFEEYGRHGGVHSEEEFAGNIDFFFEIIFDPWLSGDLQRSDGTLWKGREEVWDCWVRRVGSFAEAQRYIEAISNITAIYSKQLNME